MLSPEQYGIDAASVALGIETDQEWYRDALIFISTAKQKSSVGINNRRTNIIEGLLNHCADLPEHDKLHQLLHRAWQVMYRALRFARPANVGLLLAAIPALPEEVNCGSYASFA